MLLGNRADKSVGQPQPPLGCSCQAFITQRTGAVAKARQPGSFQIFFLFVFFRCYFLHKLLKLKRHKVALWFQVFKISRSPFYLFSPISIVYFLPSSCFLAFTERAKKDGVGNGNPLRYSCLENSMGRGAWRASVLSVTRRDRVAVASGPRPWHLSAGPWAQPQASGGGGRQGR